MKLTGKNILALTMLLTGLSACNGENTQAEEETPAEPSATLSAAESAALGENTFKTQCANCHGADGKLGVSGAKDLQLSTLSRQDALNVVKYGRGGMMAYKDFLTKDQIENVVTYIETLRKK